MVIEILEAVPAAGKTAAILSYVTETKQKAVIASISRQLNRQSYDYYLKHGGTDAIIVDTDNRQEHMSVAKSLNEVMKNQEPGVVFITHATLMQCEDLSIFKDYYLYIDEVPDMVSLNLLKFTANIDHIIRYCLPIRNEVGVYQPLTFDEDKREDLHKLAMDGYYRNDDVAEKLLPAYRCLLQGLPVTLKKETEDSYSIFFIDDYTNMNWSTFSGITIACANFEPTLTGFVMKNWSGWEFRDSHLKSRLRFEKYPNTDRVHIRVMSDQNWSRYVSDKKAEGSTGSVYCEIQNKIAEFFQNDDYIYTTNSYRARMNGQSIQYNPHGLNMYSDSTNVVALFSYNPQPWQLPILKELAQIQGVDENSLVDAFLVSKYLEPVFQLCTRGDIRNFSSKKKVYLVVPDMRAAEYLKNNYLPKAKIEMEHAIKAAQEVREAKTFNWTKGGIGAVLEMNDVEKAAFYRYCRKVGRTARNWDPSNPKDLMAGKKWLTEYREKKNKKKSGA